MRRRAPLLLLLPALLAAGCGGGGTASSTSTAAVAGAQTTEQFLSPTFRGSANAIARQVSAQVAALRRDPQASAEIGGGLQKANCTGTVNTQLTQRAASEREKRVARRLAAACGALTRALRSAHEGDRAQARRLAAQALAAAKEAVAR